MRDDRLNDAAAGRERQSLERTQFSLLIRRDRTSDLDSALMTRRSLRFGGHATAGYLSDALGSSARRPCALRAPDTYPASKMSSQGVLRMLPLLTAHSTWQHLQSLEDRERRPSREASP